MTAPFENLIHELGKVMDVSLHPDTHQSCLIAFPAEDLSVQIDLDSDTEHILIGTQLGELPPGIYRENILSQALRVNGTSQSPRGILAFSEKNNALVLFQFLKIAFLNGEKLHDFLTLFCEHAKIWKESITRGEIPQMENDTYTSGDSMFGLTR